MTLDEKYTAVKEHLQSLGKVLVAYSGGVDSTFLLKAAIDELGSDHCIAALETGPLLPQNQRERAVSIAKKLGAKLIEFESAELDHPEFSANKPSRCFVCKSALLMELKAIAARQGCEHILFGSNFDDLSDYRPGNKAIEKFGAIIPLAQAQLTKDEIRQLSEQLGLPTARQPASPCLASRIPYNQPITAEKLRQIEAGEQFLHEHGFAECRVRHHGELARIEVAADRVGELTTEPLRPQTMKKFKQLGFSYVTVDIQGFRSGSLNEII